MELIKTLFLCWKICVKISSRMYDYLEVCQSFSHNCKTETGVQYELDII